MGFCVQTKLYRRKVDGKSKEKTKTTRFHIHTDNQIDELSNR
jgi:hypothetical protein